MTELVLTWPMPIALRATHWRRPMATGPACAGVGAGSVSLGCGCDCTGACASGRASSAAACPGPSSAAASVAWPGPAGCRWRAPCPVPTAPVAAVAAAAGLGCGPPCVPGCPSLDIFRLLGARLFSTGTSPTSNSTSALRRSSRCTSPLHSAVACTCHSPPASRLLEVEGNDGVCPMGVPTLCPTPTPGPPLSRVDTRSSPVQSEPHVGVLG